MSLCRSLRPGEHVNMVHRADRAVSSTHTPLRLLHHLTPTAHDVYTGETYNSPEPPIRDYLGY
jgi:hypothetical protein